MGQIASITAPCPLPNAHRRQGRATKKLELPFDLCTMDWMDVPQCLLFMVHGKKVFDLFFRKWGQLAVQLLPPEVVFYVWQKVPGFGHTTRKCCLFWAFSGRLGENALRSRLLWFHCCQKCKKIFVEFCLICWIYDIIFIGLKEKRWWVQWLEDE